MNTLYTGHFEMRRSLKHLIFGTFLCCLIGCKSDTTENPKDLPNIIFILADDLGWKDVGYNGSSFYETPNIDKLATTGIQFTNGYANAPNCAPTRACILTGQYPQRHGILTVNQSDRGDKKAQKLIPVTNKEVLDTTSISMAQTLKTAGYHTAFIGKWHLGNHLETSPYAHSFDYSLGGWKRGSPKSYFSPYKNPALDDGPEGEHLTDRLTDEAIKYLQGKKGNHQPVFLYLSYYAVHAPFQAKDSLIQKYQSKEVLDDQDNSVYAGMIETLDTNIGKLVDYLEANDWMENTILVFCSDNGGSFRATKNTPLKGAKGMLNEGGIRIPFFIYSPANYPDPKIINQPVITSDLYPTFTDWAGSAVNPNIDGESLLPIIEQNAERKDPIYWYSPIYLNGDSDYAFRNIPSAAIRKGDYKLIWRFKDEKAELYNIKEDISEKKNLAGEAPEKYEKLFNDLKTWLAKTDGQICTELNPLYDSLYTVQKYDRVVY